MCVENAGRSQMAEAFANHYGKGKIIASSAGVRLAEKINPIVVGIMKEKGIDISSNKPKLLTPKMVEDADQVVTMGCSVEKFCPAPLFKKQPTGIWKTQRTIDRKSARDKRRNRKEG